MWAEIYSNIKYFLALTITPDVFWNVLPLLLLTVMIISYFSRYKDERAGWNTYFTNSLVLIFVSIILFRYIYNIGIPSAGNYFAYSAKSIAVLLLLTIGTLFMRFDFSHLLPERYARVINSPLTINSLAYAVILFVYSDRELGVNGALSLVIMVMILALIFDGLKIPLRIFFKSIQKEMERERIKNIKEAKLQIDEMKRELKTREKELLDIQLKELEKQEKTAKKLKKVLKK